MRYFSTLPQSQFTTTIGTFTISDFFSYYVYDDGLLNKVEKRVDNKTTLTELSYQIYKDNNSLWLFMIANNTTDPYDLLEMNPTLYKDGVDTHIAFGVQPYMLSGVTSTTYVFPSGSIVTPFGNTSGNPWEYSSIGGWDINGPFAIVESTDYYNGTLVLKEQKGPYNFMGTDTLFGDDISILQSSGTTYSINDTATDDPVYQTKNKSKVDSQIVYVQSTSTGTLTPTDVNYDQAVTEEAFAAPTSGTTLGISNYDITVSKNKNIYILPLNALPSLSLKTLKY